METILIPTDFSSNSKPGIRFAIRMAARSKAALVFIHVIPIEGDLEKANIKLTGFIAKIYHSMKLEPLDVSYEVVKGFKADISLLDYISQHPALDYVCIATRGASFLKKILGTNTSNLIEKSSIPIIVVPKEYRAKALNSIVYATDLENFEQELQKVVEYARPKGISVEVLHFRTLSTAVNAEAIRKENWEVKLNYPLTFHWIQNDDSQPIVHNIQRQLKKLKPSMICMFSNADRSFFEKLFLPSLTENVSYQTDIPLLTFRKVKK